MKGVRLFLLLTFVISSAPFAAWGQSRTGNIYGSYGRYYPWSYQPHIFWYHRRPTRYVLPWNRAPLEVVTDYKPATFHKRIPPIVVPEIPEKEVKLEETHSFTARQDFLIDTAMHRTQQDRILAVQELADHPDMATAAALIDTMINDYHSTVRIEAVQSLANLEMDSTYDIIILAKSSETNKKVIKAIESVLEQIAENNPALGSKTITVKRSRYFGSQDLADHIESIRFGKASIREEAVEELAKFKSPAALAALLNCLINDRDAIVREEAAKSLAKYNSKLALPFLEASLENDIDETVRRAAKNAIKDLE